MKKMTFAFGMICILGFTIIINAGTQASDKWIGLVELPAIFGLEDPNGPPGAQLPMARRAVNIYARPDRKAKASTTISKGDEVEFREHGYEVSSAIVYATDRGWYLIGLTGGKDRTKGWVAPEDTGKFRSLQDLIKGNLAYLTEDWDKRMAIGPGDGETQPVSLITTNEWPVEVVETRIIGQNLWVKVNILSGHCTDQTIKTLATGWVLAHAKNGRPIVWFYSRGC